MVRNWAKGKKKGRAPAPAPAPAARGAGAASGAAESKAVEEKSQREEKSVTAGAAAAESKAAEEKSQREEKSVTAGAAAAGVSLASTAPNPESTKPAAAAVPTPSSKGGALPPTLEANLDILTDEHRKLVKMLVEAGQGHLFENWSLPGCGDDDKKHQFCLQVAKLNETYPGGLVKYLQRARSLLTASKAGVNPLDGWTPSVPTGVTLEPGTDDFARMEEIGGAEVGRTGFVFVAGGLGERLGYSGIKLELPTELATETPYLGLYIHQILALERRHGSDRALPLAIMVSEDTYRGTMDLLEANDNFGMSEEGRISIMKQEKVAAIQDVDGRIALDPEDPYKIVTKPHGHGDVHSLLHSTGVAAKWAEAGIRWVVFMQDTNGLALLTLPAALGVSSINDLQVNSMAIPRKAKQAIGGIAKLRHRDGRQMTINVEYNQLDPMLRATGSGQGDVNDISTGYSPYPGNINQLIFALKPYVAVLRRTGGVLGEFVNPKYKDETRTAFKSPTRLECMMQDYPMALEPSANVGFTSVEPWACFSPVKNNLADAAKAQKGGTPAAAAVTGEADQYNAWGELMRRLHCSVEKAKAQGWGPAGSQDKVEASLGPIIVFDPSVAVSCGDVNRIFPTPEDIKISSGSALLVRGAGSVIIEKLDLDGALEIEVAEGASLVIRSLIVHNRKWSYEPLSEADMASAQTPERLKMRGYRLRKDRPRVIKVGPEGSQTRIINEGDCFRLFRLCW